MIERLSLVVAMTAAAISMPGALGCRSGVKDTAAPQPAPEATPPPPPAEPAAAPAPAADADRATWSGTSQQLVLTGTVAGTMKDAGGGKGLLTGCTKTNLGVTVNLLGVIEGAGKTPYGVKLSVLSYTGPKAYQVPKKMDLNAGASVMVNGGEAGKLPMGLFSASGTVTVDPGERHGSVDVDLKGGFGRPERGHMKGIWNCPPETN